MQWPSIIRDVIWAIRYCRSLFGNVLPM